MKLLITPFETLLNQALRLDSQSLLALQALAGKIIQIEMSGLNICLTWLVDPQGLLYLPDYQGQADTHLQGAPFTLLRSLLQRDPTPPVGIVIQGDLKTAQQLLQILHHLKIDWEEPLSRLLGDLPAHTLGRLAKELQSYANQRFQTLQLNLSEYLQEESQLFPPRLEVESFFQAVDTLRNDVERLEQRIQRLERP